MSGRHRATGVPELTIVVPVRDGIDVLPRSTAALEASSLPRELREIIVVDDGSSDGSGDWARARGYPVVDVPDGPRGPAHARNLGASAARGPVLVFVDADVCVHPRALERFARIFEAHADVAAAFGTYDEAPADARFVSQYRNLYHRFVHLQGAGEAETFWAGCGAVRTEVFLALGGFDDQRFPRPQIEDIELGYRIRDAGYRILLDPTIEGTHLKSWALPGMVRTDFLDRALPWMRLLLEERRPSTLNVGIVERIRTALVCLGVASLLIGAAGGGWMWFGLAGAAFALNIISNAGLYGWFAARRGWRFALATVPLQLLYYGVSGAAVTLAPLLHVLGRVRGGPGRSAPLRGETGPLSPPGTRRSSSGLASGQEPS